MLDQDEYDPVSVMKIYRNTFIVCLICKIK